MKSKFKIFNSKSPEESSRIAELTGLEARPGEVYAVYGEIGAGKTLFAKAFAKGLGITEEVVSPTFTIMESYEGKIPFFHFDLYRIQNESELDMLGFDEYWESEGVSFIEWPEHAGSRLPHRTIKIIITQIDENSRRIEIESLND